MDSSNKISDNGLPNNTGDSPSTPYSIEFSVYPFRNNIYIFLIKKGFYLY